MYQITLRLRSTQRIDANRWEVTIDGEPRMLTNRLVSYYVTDINRSLSRIDLNEVEEISIELPHYMAHNGIKHYKQFSNDELSEHNQQN